MKLTCSFNRKYSRISKGQKNQRFTIKSVSETHPPEIKLAEKFKEKLFLELPFYDNLLYDKTTNTIRSIIYMDPDVVNTEQRKNFIFNIFIP